MTWMRMLDMSMCRATIVELSRSGAFGFNAWLAMTSTCAKVPLDVCVDCFDKNLQVKEKFHPIEHEYMFLEVPVFGNGFHIHESKCTCCYQNPIIGIHFTCTQCKNFKLCKCLLILGQKCFFERPRSDLVSNNKRHKQDHQLEVIFEPQVQWEKRY